MPRSVVYRQSNNRLKIEAVRPFEMSIAIYLSTRHRVPEDLNLHRRCCENLKSLMVKFNTSSTRHAFLTEFVDMFEVRIQL